MSLEQLIRYLSEIDGHVVVPLGFGEPHSWRGSYDELSFEPSENISVSEMLRNALSVAGQQFQGWKGGWYEYAPEVRVHLCSQGSTDDRFGEAFFLLLQERTP